MAPRRGQHAADGAGDPLQVTRVIDQPGPTQQQIVVVGRESLEEPQQLGVVLPGVVVVGEFRRAQPLDVPGMEVLVADQAEQIRVAVAAVRAAALGHVPARRDQRGAGAVFQAAVPLLDQVVQEDPHGVHPDAFGPAQFAVDGGGVEALGLPHFQLVDGRRG